MGCNCQGRKATKPFAVVASGRETRHGTRQEAEAEQARRGGEIERRSTR